MKILDASDSLNPKLIPGGDILPGAVNTTLSYLIVLHIVALVTLSIVTCVGASAHTRKNRDKGLIRVAAQSSALAFVFVLFAFIVDFILFNNEIVKPINNKVGSVYLAEFDIAYYLMIACLVSSGLATISFFVGKIMNNRRRRKKSEEESLENEENDDFYSEVRMNEGSREQNQNQHIPKYAEFEEDVVEFDAVKQPASQFPPGSQLSSEYFNSSFPPNQPYPMGPMGPYQGHGSQPTSPNNHPFPTGMPQQFSYPHLSSQHSSPAYHSAYNSYSTTSPSMYPNSHPFPPNQPPIQSYDTYPNSNTYQGYPPQSSHHWVKHNLLIIIIINILI